MKTTKSLLQQDGFLSFSGFKTRGLLFSKAAQGPSVLGLLVSVVICSLTLSGQLVSSFLYSEGGAVEGGSVVLAGTMVLLGRSELRCQA